MTGATWMGLVFVMPSGLSSAATPKSPSPNATSQKTPSQSTQPQVVKPTLTPAPTPSATAQPTPSATPQTPAPQTPEGSTETAASQSFANDSEQVVKWLILALIPVGAVGAALYCLRPPTRTKPIDLRSPASSPPVPDSQLPTEGGTPSNPNSRPQRPQAPLPSQTAEAAVSVPSNLERSNLERASSEVIEPQVSEGASLARTTRISKVDIVEALIQDLQHPEVAQRRKSIWELGQRGDSRAIQPLVDLLVDADSQQRSLILAAIAEISTRTLKPMHRALLMSLQDESADVRKNAIRDITRIYDQMAQVSQLLQYAASDTDTEVQETARWALGQLNRFRTSAEPELKPSRPDELPRSRDPRLGDQRF